jgi:hypothetical protein
MLPDDPRHGTNAGYSSGCRQTCCRRAHARFKKGRRLVALRQHGDPDAALLVPAVGTQRRIRALNARGWTMSDIATEAGLAHRNSLWWLMSRDRVRAASRDTISAVYDRLAWTVPDETTGRKSVRTAAARKGWPAPWQWLDIDDPDETPDPGYQPPTRRDWLALVEDWAACGRDRTAVAAALGITVRSLEKRCVRVGRRDLWTQLAKEAA